jgi:hypothetical protein
MRRTVVIVLALAVAGSATHASAVEVVAAGDIATGGKGDTETSDRVLTIDPDVVLTLGDHTYHDGALEEFRQLYEPTWGRFRDITRPTPGNHDWNTPGAAGYESYFGREAGRVHTFVTGAWRVIALDSDVRIARQDAKLAAILREDTHRCELLYFHHPRWSSGENDDQPQVGPWWTTAYANGVDVILSAHDHDYERFGKKDADGVAAADGIRQFIVGTGGAPTSAFQNTEPGSKVRITGNEHWGVLAMDLVAGSYSWRFVDADTGDALDSGSATCHR